MSLSSAELASIQSIEEVWMTTACTIYRPTLTADGIGGYSELYEAVEETICDLWEVPRLSSENFSSANQDTSYVYWFLTVPFDTSILEKDVVVIGNISFDIISVPLQHSLNTAYRCKVVSRNRELQLVGNSVLEFLEVDDGPNDMFLRLKLS